MTLQSGVASRSYTFSAAGSYSVQAWCRDAASNAAFGSSSAVTVSAVSTGDVTPPVVGGVTPTTLVAGQSATFSASYADAGRGVEACYLFVDGVSQGLMSRQGTAASGTATKAATISVAGSHTARVDCHDAAGNVGRSSLVAVQVSSGVSSSPTSFTPSTVRSSVVFSTRSVRANASDAVTVSVTVRNAESQAISGASVSITSSRGSTDTVQTIRGVTDGSGSAQFLLRSGTSGTPLFTVTAAGVRLTDPVSVTFTAVPVVTTQNPPSPSGTGSLIKMICPSGAGSDHPCRAVYYLSRNGTRHAFPHERVFFTWYADFSNVVEVSSQTLAGIPLGSMVTYRPGVRIVKFRTVPQVYAVTRNGVLRWIMSEQLASSIYGSTWAMNVHDIPDAFYTNYRFGADILSASDFRPAEERDRVSTIDDNF